MKILHSPNFDDREENITIDMIIIHYTQMNNMEDALNVYLDESSKLSCHYAIAKNGEIYKLVPEEKRAYHAGKSFWNGREAINNYSIGIELDNNGNEEFSASQMNALIELCQNLKNKYQIKDHNILGHSDIAPGRKKDPGRLFNWQKLHQNNLGLYIESNTYDKHLDAIEIIQEKLKSFGYNIEITGILDEKTINVMTAFCDHFYQENRDNKIDAKLCMILDKLSKLVLT